MKGCNYVRIRLPLAVISLALLCLNCLLCKSRAEVAEPQTIFTKDIDVLALSQLFSLNSSEPILSTFDIKAEEPCFSDSQLSFGHDYAVKEALPIRKAAITLVSIPRLIATIWLARAALTLPAGDFVETGVYKGGASVLLIRMLQNYDTCGRHFWGFDSFQGLPESVAQDQVGHLSRGATGQYATSEKTFLKNLRKHNAYTNPSIVHSVKGFFNETLPTAPIDKIALLRLDGDIYTSTWDSLTNLYNKVVPGGYVYVDDYDSFNGCKLAVDTFRSENQITEPMVKILEGKRPDQRMKRAYEAVWWQKRSDVAAKS